MATGTDIVYGALRKLGVRNAESPIEAFELTDGIEVLNDMMTEWEESGLLLGYMTISVGADEVRVPRGTHDAIKAQLAIRLAPDYEKPITPALAATAKGAMNNLIRANLQKIDVKFPDTLPLGGGNQCTDFEDQRYFPDNEEENF